ncbi:MAG: hypothetical protein ABI151_02470 [Chitinophagaceae bacterium]
MKKFLLVLVIGATFAACNDSATTETKAGDTSTMAPAEAPMMSTPDTMHKMGGDTSSKMMGVDTTKK